MRRRGERCTARTGGVTVKTTDVIRSVRLVGLAFVAKVLHTF